MVPWIARLELHMAFKVSSKRAAFLGKVTAFILTMKNALLYFQNVLGEKPSPSYILFKI